VILFIRIFFLVHFFRPEPNEKRFSFTENKIDCQMVKCVFVSLFLPAKIINASEFYHSGTIDPGASLAEPFSAENRLAGFS
jgi:hypothetical protein